MALAGAAATAAGGGPLAATAQELPDQDRQPGLLPERLVGSAPLDGIVFTAADGTRFGIETVATGLEAPGSLAFAPDGRLFLAEGAGRVRVLTSGGPAPAPVLALQPEPAFALTNASAAGWPVISGLALDPEFARNGYIYLLQTDDWYRGAPAARLVRYRAGGDALLRTGTLLDGLPSASPARRRAAALRSRRPALRDAGRRA